MTVNFDIRSSDFGSFIVIFLLLYSKTVWTPQPQPKSNGETLSLMNYSITKIHTNIIMT